MTDFTRPDAQGMRVGANMRASLTNASTATGNLADATEALKHNFLVRGFFRKRGYYNLADLSHEKYRVDRAFTSPPIVGFGWQDRTLFQIGPDGNEQLSPNGKALIDSLLTEDGDRIVEGPIVVEGYWNGEIAADQLRISPSRAMAVRQYVHARFELDSKDLGAVPLRNLPPQGRGSWNMGWSLFGVLEERLKGVPRGWQSKYPSPSMVNDSKRFADSGGWGRQYPIRPPITRFDAFSTRHLAVEFSIDRGCFDPLSLFRMKQTTWSVGIWDSQADDF